MKDGLAELGIEAWYAQGNFKGLRTVVEGYEKAQQRLSQKDFAAALSKVVGKPALAGAMAHLADDRDLPSSRAGDVKQHPGQRAPTRGWR
ncbi:hypothetical protein, partial [Streptomyces virginiae]